MKRILDKPYMEGICPCCGSQIEYGQRNHMDNGGTIDHVDDGCQLQMRWDCGRSLALIPGVDEYVVLSYPTRKRR